MSKDLSGRAGEGDTPAADHDQAVHSAGHLLHGVGDEDNGGVFGPEIVADVAQNGFHAHRVQTGGGLVQHQNGGLHGDDAGNGDPALLAAGELEGGLFQHRVGKPHKGCGVPDPTVNLRLVKPHVAGAEGDILVNRLLKELVLRILKDQAYLKAGLAGALLGLPDVAPFEEDPARGGLQQGVQMLDQSGLAGTRPADDAEIFPAVGGEVHIHQGAVLERGAGGVDVAELFRLNDRFQRKSVLTL